jgi:acetylornithine deacetylase
MLNAHLDTVGFGGMDQPLRPRIEGDRLHGRGAHDMKSGLAVALAVAAEVAKAPLAGDLVVAAVADEEAASVGTSEVLGHVRTDGAIVTEPTGLDIVRAHGGFVWLELDVRGRAAHGSQPADGVDAIVHAALILAELPELSRTLARAPGHELLGPGSLHAGTIAGGVEPSSYPARCRVELERRLVPGETVGGTLAEIEALIATVRARVPELDATVSVSLERPPFVSPPDGLLLQTLAGAATAAGRSADVTGHRAWMDASLLSRAGIDCVVYGPLGHGAHADVEWVDIPSLTTCADTVLRTAREYCR